MDIRFILFIILAVCIAAAAVAVILFAAASMRRQTAVQKPAAVPESLPGGGGAYTMKIANMNCEHCKASVEAALNAFEGVQARADLKTETVYIRYSGYPELELLDRLRSAVEDAGFSVTEIS